MRRESAAQTPPAIHEVRAESPHGSEISGWAMEIDLGMHRPPYLLTQLAKFVSPSEQIYSREGDFVPNWVPERLILAGLVAVGLDVPHI